MTTCNHIVTLNVTRRLQMKNTVTLLLICLFLGCSSTVKQNDDSTNSLPTEFKIWESIIDDARFAQNAHNIQSWKINIISELEVTISLELDRLLPETDPINRQLVLSLGAFTAVAEMKAAELGYKLTSTWIGPESVTDNFNALTPLIILKLENSDKSSSNELMDALSSPTIKYAVQTADFDKEWGHEVVKRYSNSLVSFNLIDNKQDVDELKALALDAFIIEMETPASRDESVMNTHIGKRIREEKPYGITLFPNFKKGTFPIMEFFSVLFPLKDDAFSKQSIKMFEKALTPAQILVSMTTVDNRLETQFRSGIEMQKMWMEFIEKDYSLLPLSQGLQEYEEVSQQYIEFHNRLTKGDETIQMLWSLTSPISGEFLQSPRVETKDIVTF